MEFDLYEKVHSIISTQRAPEIAADMIEFTVRMVATRWSAILCMADGHRDALTDPNVHDRLLFDDYLIVFSLKNLVQLRSGAYKRCKRNLDLQIKQDRELARKEIRDISI